MLLLDHIMKLYGEQDKKGKKADEVFTTCHTPMLLFLVRFIIFYPKKRM
jgi:hypothetical protein